MFRVLIFLAGLFWSVSPVMAYQHVPSEPNETQVDEERDQLWAAAQEAKVAGKLREAAQLGEKMFQLERAWNGENNARLISTLHWLAEVYLQQQDWKNAILRQELAVEKSAAIRGDRNWKTTDERVALSDIQQRSKLTKAQRNELERANQLNQQCITQYSAGNYVDSIEAAKSDAEILRKVLGQEHPDHAAALRDLAFLYQSMGEFKRAKPLYVQCLDIEKKVLGEEHPGYAQTVSNLAFLCRSMGEYARAASLYSQAVEIQKNVFGEEDLGYAVTIGDLALLHQDMGDYARAEPLFLQCRDVFKKNLGEQHSEYATLTSNLALLYQSKGDYTRAAKFYSQALDIQKSVLGEEHPSTIMTLSNLATLYSSIGDYARAEPLHIKCKEVRTKVLGKKHPDYAGTLNNLAVLYHSMGDYARAERFYIQCKEIQKKVLGEEHPSYAKTLNNLAALYKSIGDYKRAKGLYFQCKEIQKKGLGAKHPSYATTLNNLAGLCQSMGDFAKAELLYKQVQEIDKKVLGEGHLDYATTLNNLALLYRSMADYTRAEIFQSESLKITFNSLKSTAVVLSERQQLAMSQTLRFRLDNYLSLAIDEGTSFRAKATRQVLAWKGGTLVRQRAMRLAASEPVIAEQFRELQAVASQLASLSRAMPDVDLDNRKQRIRELTAVKEQLESELSQSSSTFRGALKEITPELIQSSIPAGTVLIDYLQYTHAQPSKEKKGELIFTPSLLAVVATRTGDPKLIELGQIASLSEAIDQWRKTFGMSPQGKQAAIRIRKQIWEPVLESIRDSETVLVSTDGVLGRLPIGALPGEKPGTYLIEDHRIAMLPVPQLLPALVHAEGTKELDRELLLLGDVDYDADSESAPKKKRKKRRPGKSRADGIGQEFAHLDGAAGEVAAIQVLYQDLFEFDSNDVKSLKKAAASEAMFRKHAGQYRCLHLATHGFFASAELKSALGSDELQPSSRGRLASSDREVRGMNPDLLSGLALAGANLEPVTGKDDGILTAQEIAFLPLDGVETAVLSACETGLGEVAGGEGLIGVQRAFQIAGVRTTVASLWKVNDQATRFLMERFYRNLWEKEMGHLDALREAQLHILNNPESVRSSLQVVGDETKKRASPELWAAFQISGSWK